MSKHHSKFWGIAGAAVLTMAFQGAAWAGEHGCTGECYEPVAPKVIHKTMRHRITTEQGVYEITRKPALYGWVKHPAYEQRDAVYRTETVRVQLPARYMWEKRWVGERYVMCKVRVPGEVVERERSVLVSRGGYVRTGEYEERRILLKQYKNIAIYNKARHQYVTERATIQPEGVVWRKVPKSAYND